MNVLPTCMYVHHMWAWFPRQLEEVLKYSGTGVSAGLWTFDAKNQICILCKGNKSSLQSSHLFCHTVTTSNYNYLIAYLGTGISWTWKKKTSATCISSFEKSLIPYLVSHIYVSIVCKHKIKLFSTAFASMCSVILPSSSMLFSFPLSWFPPIIFPFPFNKTCVPLSTCL